MSYEDWKLQKELDDSAKASYSKMMSYFKISIYIVIFSILIMALIEGISFLFF